MYKSCFIFFKMLKQVSGVSGYYTTLLGAKKTKLEKASLLVQDPVDIGCLKHSGLPVTLTVFKLKVLGLGIPLSAEHTGSNLP